MLPYTNDPTLLELGPCAIYMGEIVPDGVTSVAVTNGGSGYTGVPTVSFTGGVGTGAAATAVVEGGVVTRVDITNTGTGYTGVPTVAFTGGGGTGAAATAAIGGAFMQNVGYTDDDTTISITGEVADLTASQEGTTPVNKVVTGVNGVLEFSFKEMRMENWKRALANARVYKNTGNTLQRMEVLTSAGLDLRSISRRIELRPLIGGAETSNIMKIFVIPIAAPSGDTVSLAFGNTAQRALKATFYMFPDPSKRSRIMYMGSDDASVNVLV